MSLKDFYHFSQAYNIKQSEDDFDFFDVNLAFDSRLFVDPFLLKKSMVEEERELYPRFGKYFESVLERTVKVLAGRESESYVYDYLKFPEPKEVCLGYTRYSIDGAGLGSMFASAMTAFFLRGIAGKLVTNRELFEKGAFNPEVFIIFADKVADDGISDLSIQLITDYLIKYTQKQCEIYNVPLKNLPVRESFDFENMEWTGGHYSLLPENLTKPGTPVILIPKRLLRSSILSSNEVKAKAVGLLRSDPMLKIRFENLVSKPLAQIDLDEVRGILMNDEKLLKRFIQVLELDSKAIYDFDRDPLEFLALKKMEKHFDNISFPDQPSSCDDVIKMTERLIFLFKELYERRDHWRDAWTLNKKGILIETKEVAWGRSFRASGIVFFDNYPQVTFGFESSTGNGMCDFTITYLECKIMIELKKLSNEAYKGTPALPSYIHGMKVQLPEYTVLSRGTHAIYITGQHRYKNRNGKGYSKTPLADHSGRVKEIQALIPQVQKELKDQLVNFNKVMYYNIDLAYKPSASRL